MIIVFESILPIFLLVLLGAWLKRTTLVDQNLWLGLEQFGYYILFPALLFSTLAQADFSGMKADATAIATIGSVSLMSVFVLLLWPLFRNREVSGASFTSVFQTATRWNGFMALAIAQKALRTDRADADGAGDDARRSSRSISTTSACWFGSAAATGMSGVSLPRSSPIR